MANPQLEDGYIKIANELFDALCRIRVPGEVRQVIDVIFRKTYGFNKKSDRIALSQFAFATGMKKPSIIRAQKKAIGHKFIYRSANGEWRILKDYSAWKPFTKVLTISKSVNASFTKVLHTKDTTTKDRYNISERTADIKKEIKGLAGRKGFGGASYEWQDAACRAWKALNLKGSPSSSFFRGFRDHRARAESVVGEVIEIGARDPEQYFYKMMAVRLNQNVAK